MTTSSPQEDCQQFSGSFKLNGVLGNLYVKVLNITACIKVKGMLNLIDKLPLLLWNSAIVRQLLVAPDQYISKGSSKQVDFRVPDVSH